MGWAELTPRDVESVLNVGEIADYRKHCIALPDPLPTVLSDVTHLIRGYLATRCELEPRGIPDELRAPCLDIVAYRLIRRVRPDVPDNDSRRAASNNAEELLKAVRDGEHGAFGAGERGAYGSATPLEL
jgi:hypothetical protein